MKRSLMTKSQTVLGISGSLTEAVLENRFKALANQYHPDKHLDGDTETVNLQFFEIKKAYDYLKCALNEGDFTEFNKRYGEETEDCKSAAERTYKQGIMLYKQGDINNSLECFLKAQQCDESNFDYERAILRCLMEKPRRVYEAKERCLKLITKDTYFGENYYLMGRIYDIAGLVGAAAKYYNKARELGYENHLMKQKGSVKDQKKGVFTRLFKKG